MPTKDTNRRLALQVVGAASVAALIGSKADAAAVCKADVESTAGPYPNINPLERKDLRSNTKGNTAQKQGAKLTLRLRVHDIESNCAAIPGAVVDIWSADAVGNYSSYSPFGTQGQDYCRGYQKTDANGMVEFVTLFPGSYSGRAIHIHFSIQSSATNIRPNADGRSEAKIFIGQLYFKRADVDEVFNSNPIYKQGARITPNESDSIYVNDGGNTYLVPITKNGADYVGEFDIGVKRAAVGLPPVTSTTVELTSGKPSPVDLAMNQQKLFIIKVPAGKAKLTFGLSGGTGNGDLYARFGAAPTTMLYDKKAARKGNAAESMLFNRPKEGTYYVLVNAVDKVAGAKLVGTVS